MLRTLVWSHRRSALCFCFFIVAMPVAAQVSFTPLGDLPGGQFGSGAFDISADGLVVVGHGETSAGDEPFRWTAAGGMVALGPLPVGRFGFAWAVSADGSVVVGSTGPGTREAFRWTTEDGMRRLGSDETPDSVAWDVSADGSVVVGIIERPFPSQREAFRWTESTGIVGLGDFGATQLNSGADAISSDGTVVVGYGNSTDAFRWTSTEGMIRIGDLPGGDPISHAFGVSADGSVIVGVSSSGRSGGFFEAFRWTADGGMIGLGDFPGGEFFSHALDVSADGSVVVGYGHRIDEREAFYWTAESGMVHLRDSLVAGGASNLDGWTLIEANGISADGKTIVGAGINPAGQQEAWIATIPEPSTFILAALAAAGVTALSARRRRAVKMRKPGNRGDIAIGNCP